MATIRVRDWTKARIEEIQAAESHSSHDSVIKTLLKDRQLAEYAGEAPAPGGGAANGPLDLPGEPAFDDLTVFAELDGADNGVLFVWCPSCGNEIAHLVVGDPFDIPVFEVECQRCLARLDQHALVGIEIGYPLERRLVEGAVDADLRDCVVDYWDRALAALGAGVNFQDGTEPEALVWQLGQYLAEFNWDWPADVPAVGLRAGEAYRDRGTDERLEVLDRVVEGANRAYRIRRGEGAEPETVDAQSLTERLLERALYVAD
ncbi:MAG: hypothetical protein U5J98_00500 [Halobacteriales archaeon]|nr:hypothetical protein [Halobacteriales archaeon]